MSEELHYFNIETTLKHNILKVKVSLEEIQKNRPDRKDLIDSMTETKEDLLMVLASWKALTQHHMNMRSRLISLESNDIQLRAEVRELKSINSKMIDNLNP